MQRKPSHFGSYRSPSWRGTSCTALASIGLTGGMTGRSTAGTVPASRRMVSDTIRRGSGAEGRAAAEPLGVEQQPGERHEGVAVVAGPGVGGVRCLLEEVERGVARSEGRRVGKG